MKNIIIKQIIFFVFLFDSFFATHAQKNYLADINTLPAHPRILFMAAEEENIKQKIAFNEQLNEVHKLLLKGADDIIQLAVSERIQTGRRLLDVSREVLRRNFLLGYAYRMTQDAKYYERAEKEMLAVAQFSDWNPSHFLDVAEMTTAMSVGYDWFYNVLSENDRKTISSAIMSKGLVPSLYTQHNDWLYRDNNWNQVCNTGMTLGALAIYDEFPVLAELIINRSIESIQIPMKEYLPKGAYPEGYSYWGYGTTYNVLFLDVLDKNFNTDFSIINSGFLQTGEFILHMIAPSGKTFNFGDNSDSGRLNPAMFWFADKNNNFSILWNELLFLKEKNPASLINNRLFMPIILWGTNTNLKLPEEKMWVAQNTTTPVALMRTSWTDKNAIYLAFKGGTAMAGHAHLDVGSFIMEADGERWAMDFGWQDYHSLESKGLDLWNKSQNSDRWKVFRYNNLTHNTLSVDNQFQRAEGYADILSYSTDKKFMNAVADISPVYEGQLEKALRGAGIVDEKYVVIRDEIKTLEKESMLRWTMLTPADARILNKNTIELTKNKKKLIFKVESPNEVNLKIWNTNPPSDYDVDNDGTLLVGFEVRIPPNQEQVLQVKLIPQKSGKTDDQISSLKEW